MSSPWRIDAGLAAALAEVTGWSPGDGVPALIVAQAARWPAGSTAKLEAMAAGAIPPGDDPAALAATVVADAEAHRPGPSWSCWVLATLFAALVETTGTGRARVAAVRRIDAAAPPVDLHSAVLVDEGGGSRWLCDPYFAFALPGPGADEVEGPGGSLWATRRDGTDGRWSYRITGGRFAGALAYRAVAPVLDPGDVRALCAVSVTHSGVSNRPWARIEQGGAVTEASVAADGVGRLRRWLPARPGTVFEGHLEDRHLPGWIEAAAALTDVTGVHLR